MINWKLIFSEVMKTLQLNYNNVINCSLTKVTPSKEAIIKISKNKISHLKWQSPQLVSTVTRASLSSYSCFFMVDQTWAILNDRYIL